MSKKRQISVWDFFDLRIKELERANRMSTASNYLACRNSLHRYHPDMLTFADLTESFMVGYEDYLRQRQLQWNTISFHNRILRALRNEAVRRHIAVGSNPFGRVYLGIGTTRKRTLTTSELARLNRLHYEPDSSLALARDMFLFSFAAQGMPFIDMAFLRLQDIGRDYITYRRRKTGKIMHVYILPPIRTLIERYRSPEAVYLFPVVSSTEPAVAWREYKKALARFNYHLRQLQHDAELSMPLTSYVARHTWANEALRSEVPVSIISAAMGHASEKTTHVYLSSLDDSLVDAANRAILNRLKVNP